jgi:hypothetical protein
MGFILCLVSFAHRVGSDAVGWSEAQAFTSPPSAASVAAGTASFTFLVFNDVGQENAVLFDDVCPPYCPGGWTFEPYTANSTKLLKHLMAEPEARLGLLVGDVAYANGYLVRRFGGDGCWGYVSMYGVSDGIRGMGVHGVCKTTGCGSCCASKCGKPWQVVGDVAHADSDQSWTVYVILPAD